MKPNIAINPNANTGLNKVYRALWHVFWLLLFLPSPVFAYGWRSALLRLFGARVGRNVKVYPSARIWSPRNLELGDGSCIAKDVDCYCVDRIIIGARVVVSQYSYLCTASHDFNHPEFLLVSAPIVIKEGAWIAADAFIGPGVVVGQYAVVAARATVVKDVDQFSVVGGNPARTIGSRSAGIKR